MAAMARAVEPCKIDPAVKPAEPVRKVRRVTFADNVFISRLLVFYLSPHSFGALRIGL
jgi:hypothetical protein